MSAKKKKPSPKKKTASPPPKPPSAEKRPKDRLKGARKIGSRIETVVETLSPMEIEKERGIVCDRLREISRVKEAHKTATADAKAKVQKLEEEKDIALRNANTGRRDRDVFVEEWLDDRNNVLRIRTDTGDIIGERTSRPDELQEVLDLVDESADENDGDENDGNEETESADEGDESPPNPAGDFGDNEHP